MIKRIKSTGQPDWEMKRFYIPATMYADCPKCGEECVTEGDDDYVSYGGPGINQINFQCYSDEDAELCNEWEEKVLVELKVKKVPA